MKLEDIRREINSIDSEFEILFARRMNCTSLVANTKMESNDEVLKPLREKEILSRYEHSGNAYIKPFMKKLVQISRKKQYELFIESNKMEEGFYPWLGERNSNVLTEGGILKLELVSDETFTEGISKKDMLSIISDANLEVVSLESRQDKVNVSFLVSEHDREEAKLVAYMLYKESLKNK